MAGLRGRSQLQEHITGLATGTGRRGNDLMGTGMNRFSIMFSMAILTVFAFLVMGTAYASASTTGAGNQGNSTQGNASYPSSMIPAPISQPMAPMAANAPSATPANTTNATAKLSPTTPKTSLTPSLIAFIASIAIAIAAAGAYWYDRTQKTGER